MKTLIEYDTRTGEVLKALYQTKEAANKGKSLYSEIAEVSEEEFKLASTKPTYFQLSELKAIPDKPKEGYVFNFSTKLWEDARTLDEVKDAVWDKLKLERDALEFNGFTFKGYVFDSDQISQGRILAASSLGVDIEWTLANNEVITLTAEDLPLLVLELSKHISNAHSLGRKARDAVYSATDIASVEAVTL